MFANLHADPTCPSHSIILTLSYHSVSYLSAFCRLNYRSIRNRHTCISICLCLVLIVFYHNIDSLPSLLITFLVSCSTFIYISFHTFSYTNYPGTAFPLPQQWLWKDARRDLFVKSLKRSRLQHTHTRTTCVFKVCFFCL